MDTITEKISAIIDAKADIKNKLSYINNNDIGDVLSVYGDKIADTIDTCLFGNIVSLTSNISYIERSLLAGNNTLLDVYLPNLSNTANSAQAFKNCTSLSSVYAPNLLSIQGSMFSGCTSLAEINISSATHIMYLAFQQSRVYGDIKLPNVIYIGDSAFNQSGGYGYKDGRTLYAPKCLSVGSLAFQSCYGISSVYMPELMAITGQNAFAFGFQTETISRSCGHGNFPKLTSIAQSGFNSSRFKSVYIPQITTLPNQCFSGASELSSFESDAVISIEQRAFNGCLSLLSVNLPNVSSNVGTYAFGSCPSLMRVIIPCITGTIQNYAFSGDTALEVIDMSLGTTLVSLASTYAFSNVPTTCKIIVADNLVDSYKSATNWSTFTDMIIGRSDAISQGIITGEY